MAHLVPYVMSSSSSDEPRRRTVLSSSKPFMVSVTHVVVENVSPSFIQSSVPDDRRAAALVLHWVEPAWGA